MQVFTHQLSTEKIPSNVLLGTPNKNPNNKITEASPALTVMTDFAFINPFSIEPDTLIDDANKKMIACGVRLLFVQNKNEDLLGLITSNDLLGEKPLLYITQNSISRNEVEVRNLMTPLEKIESVDYKELEKSVVGDVIELLKESKRNHMLVIEKHQTHTCVRGLISLSQVGRQLGEEITKNERAATFSALNKALS